MRILVASPYLPWPLNSGGNAAQFSTLKCLAEDHQFTLVCRVFNDEGMANAEGLQAQLPSVKVRAVFCGTNQMPGPKPGLPLRLARWLVRTGRKVLNPPSPTPQPAALPHLYYPFAPLPQELIGALEEEKALGVDLFQAEFAEMMPLGSWFPGDKPKLFVHHQVHFVYAERFLQTHGRTAYTNYLEAVMKTEEINYLQKFQGVITFSEDDRQTLLPYVAAEKLFTSSFPIPADVGIAVGEPSPFDGRFLFLASEEHAPNRDALEWLLAKIWPEIFGQLPSARLVVIGRWSESARAKFAAPGVTFSGFVKDLPSALRGGIMLVPLRIGSGIRVKIMVAMAQGTPVVSTTVGGEGLCARDGVELLVRDDAHQFAVAAVQLARDAGLSKRLALAGRSAVARNYSAENVRQRRNEIYETLARFNRNPSLAGKARAASTSHQPSRAAEV